MLYSTLLTLLYLSLSIHILAAAKLHQTSAEWLWWKLRKGGLLCLRKMDLSWEHVCYLLLSTASVSQISQQSVKNLSGWGGLWGCRVDHLSLLSLFSLSFNSGFKLTDMTIALPHPSSHIFIMDSNHTLQEANIPSGDNPLFPPH